MSESPPAAPGSVIEITLPDSGGALPLPSISQEERGELARQVQDNLLGLAPMAVRRLAGVLKDRDTKTPQLLEAIRLTLNLAGFVSPKPQAAEAGRKSLEDMSAEDLRQLAQAASVQLSNRAVIVTDSVPETVQVFDPMALV